MTDQNIYLRFLVPMRPISVNKMYRNFRGRTIKSAECRQFEATFDHFLAEFSSHAIDFMRYFNPETDALHVDIICYIDKKDFFTKSGRIHKRCGDVDGYIKCTLDQVFDFIELDDALVTRISCSKVPSDSDSTEILIRKVISPSKTMNPEPRAMLGGRGLQ
jgi:Holliday junction resolvase RusA-like endonuclease